MAKKIVLDYKVAWNVGRDAGVIGVKLEGISSYKKLPIDNVAEFQALLTLLQGPKAVYIDTKKNIVATAP